MELFDIFISYKRKSLNFANNLYYRLTQRGYSVFFDLEEMRRDRFDEQLFRYIEAASDVFVILEDGSLGACTKEDWNQDWFCREISHALERKKNIIPILLDGFKMPPVSFFPDELKGLPMIEARKFDIVYFDQYLDVLEKKDFLVSKPRLKDQEKSVFKLYSNRDTEVYKDGKLVGRLTGEADEPFYIPVPRKGSYRFKGIDVLTGKEMTEKCQIEADAEEEVEFIWEIDPVVELNVPEAEEDGPGEAANDQPDNDRVRVIKVDDFSFSMVYVDGGLCGGKQVKPFYIGQFPVTQNIWEHVMGNNPSRFRESKVMDNRWASVAKGAAIGLIGGPLGMLAGGAIGLLKRKATDEFGHFPVETIDYLEASRFLRLLSEKCGLLFSFPTELEWEYAAKGGTASKELKFAGSDSIDEVAWYRGNSKETTHPVGQKKPNELGLYDMCGNVWEWVEIPHSSSKAVRKGGSWWQEPHNCEITSREVSELTSKSSAFGLRVVLHDFEKSGKAH